MFVNSTQSVFVSVQVRLSQLMRQRECLLRESEATVARRETIVLRKEAMMRNSLKQATQGDLSLSIQGLQRKIREAHKVKEADGTLIHLCLEQVEHLFYMQDLSSASGRV